MIFYNYKNKPHSSKKKVSLIPKINIKNIYIYIYIVGPKDLGASAHFE